MTAPLPLSDHFQQLDRLLWQLRTLWQLRPFAQRTPPWSHYPGLHAWLDSLSETDCAALERDDQARAAALAPFIPAAPALQRLTGLPAITPPAEEPIDPRLSYHIPGRKLDQIRAFDRALQPSGTEFLEWCAGKGHLGRLLAHNHRRPVRSLEWQAALCADGQRLANQLQLPCRLHQQDVLQPQTAQHLHPAQHAVALHACGKLHLRLLRLVVEHRLSGVTLSPCCYQLIDGDSYQPLSRAAATSPLRLATGDLKLCLQDTVTAGSRERRLRTRELHWRLGFDLLQRAVRGCDHYLPCPTIPKSRLNGRFAEFCHWMAERKALSLPAGLDYDRFEAAGVARVSDITRMELVRNLFRRPLELWLALDRALYLQEQGYAVRLTQFCAYQLTPRNLLIEGIRRD